MDNLKSKINILDYSDQLRPIIERHFHIEIIRYGEHQDTFLARYEGHLIHPDSEKAYDQLALALEPLNLMPLFRLEDQAQVILLVPLLEKKKASNPWINLLFFILTVFSVLTVGSTYGLEALPEKMDLQAIQMLVLHGLPFTISMLTILLAHEFGHYFAGRYHKVHVSLPYFIPFPGSLMGTMGAFINIKEIPKNRKQLMDIGIAGPLAGFVVAVPILFYGLKLSTLGPLPLASSPTSSLILEGNSILYLALKYLAFGQLLPAPVDYGGVMPVLYWLRYFFTGTPFPFGGMDVQLNSIAWAGWAGLLVTMLNLVPAGQLDGGHLFFVMFGKKGAKRIYPWILGILLGLGIFWTGWWFWAALIFLFGRMHAEPLDQITPLDPARKRLAVVGLLIFVLCFIPVPLLLF
jgi:membrane-associated protease RseP (regulator of RpoE activity)